MEKPVQWMTLQELRDELDRTRPAWEAMDVDPHLPTAQESGSAATSALSSSPQKVRKTSANSHQLLTVQTGTISCGLNTNSQPFIGKYVTLSQQRAIIVL